jgi:DNA replicative helicase MCM subunit Mcm2 (Cdc46/Mcm family)
MTCDRLLADMVSPGNRVKVVGIYLIMTKGSQETASSHQQVRGTTKIGYVRAIGIQPEHNHLGASGANFALPNITQDDEQKIMAMGRDVNIF